MSKIGYTDVPVETLKEDEFDIDVYVKALAKFVLDCQTPMTIAIQGGWGSGKSSFMNMIKAELQTSVVPSIQVWFNTWQFSQFQMQGLLSITFLSQLLGEISSEKANNLLQTLSRGLSSFSKNLAVVAVEKTLGETMAGNLNDKFSGDGVANTVDQMKKLKDQIQLAVANKLEKEKKDRIVFFIDDLDRLPPEVAVEILEVLKIFLDVPKTIFVLAIDYDVVITGIQNKYGAKIDSAKGRSFFDKIIQLPFTVPIGQYNISKYVQNLLDKMGIKEDDDKVSFEELIRASVGCNPRSIKRVFNTFYLLNTVAELKKINIDIEKNLVSKRQKIIFGVLCLQLAYEPIYEFLIKEEENFSKDFFEQFTTEKLLNDDYFKNLRPLVKDNVESYFRSVSEFLGLFFEVIQLDKNSDELSIEEIENLRQILNFSSVTANSSDTISAKHASRIRSNSWSDYQSLLCQFKIASNVIQLLKKIDEIVISMFASDQIKVQYAPTALSFQANVSKRKKVFLYCSFKKSAVRCWFGDNGKVIDIITENDLTDDVKTMIRESFQKIISQK
ncbi:MAG: hypothetical protein HQM10_00255 [Candidatus Riflebacteria bacterium]|nr:hypothetical protein [Candidatus Riflebacteria bacterium]